MAKKIIKEKPKEVLNIEKALGIILVESNRKKYRRNTYSIDSNNHVTSIYIFSEIIKNPEIIKNFPNLRFLGLPSDHIDNLNFIRDIKSIHYLNLSDNDIEDITSIASLLELEELHISYNPIKDITPIERNTNLITLSISYNAISNIEFIHNLKKLEDLEADSNLITDISVIEYLPKLKRANFENNLLQVISSKIARQFNWLKNSLEDGLWSGNGLFISNNPLTFPPTSVIELGSETIKSYYEMAEDFGHKPLSEGRILFVGDGSSGKSSIIEKVLYNTFQKGREQTNGIKLEHLHLQHPEDQRDLVFHIWDFGGQEIQHAVHKFFFTEGCLYVLVLDNRKEEEPEYWLQQIESLGGKAPVLVVFNKQDENADETVDRKYLKEKYPNIVGFYNTSCANGFGIDDFKKDLERYAIQLRTVEEQFPQNWFSIKKSIEKCTSGKQHYLNYDSYKEICKQNHVEQEEIQKLLLRYLTTIGAVTWFGDTYLNFMHVLSPAWITQGVYKIITAKKTAHLFGQIEVSDFKELLQPISKEDFTYDENHYGYILSMMKKFDLCFTDDKNLLIPSAFGKAPKVEYSDFRGEQVRIYILQFKDYMPLALIHRYISKNLPTVFENNYWYSGIVTKDSKTDSLAMVHADKEAKRIYIRIKGETPLGMWEHIRREFSSITSNYANIRYKELISLDDAAENIVDYEDLVSHIRAKKSVYFHPKLGKDFNVGYLMGMFESKESSIEKIKKGELHIQEETYIQREGKIPPFAVNILNNNSPTVQVNTQINIDIDIQLVNNVSSDVKGDANYLLESLDESNKTLRDALSKVIQFTDDAKAAQNSGHVKEKGWGRKLKGVLQTLKSGNEYIKSIQDGGETLKSIFHGMSELAQQFNLHDIVELLKTFS